MKNNKQLLKWILIVGLIYVLFSMKDTVPTQSVVAIEGQPCTKDEHCPCFGTYNVSARGGTILQENATAYGIGVARCINNKCDITYCLDIQPTAEWLRDKPWHYLRTHPLIAVALIITIIGLIAWPNI